MNSYNKPFLSICIPTFNRSESVYKLANNILKYQGTDIEVIVLDNSSTDNTKRLLSTIKDSRFKYTSNEINIGGILNPLKVIIESKGEYSILCLDKDIIDYKEISTLIDILKKDKSVVFGYCALDLNERSSDLIFEKGFYSVLNMAYLGKHPSGYFYKTKYYNSSITLNEIFTNNLKFVFYFDLINAEMSFKGNSKVINQPIFYTENRSDCAKVASFTYNKNDLYFEPQKRSLQYFTYMKSVCKLELTEHQINRIIKLLFYRGLFVSTFSYKSILADPDLCSHHGINTQIISFFELIKIDINYSYAFLKESLSISILRKLLICYQAHSNLVIKGLRNKLSYFP